ncbi:MAG: hypothetical protein MUF42_05780 [Cytophagaceae bacterium]|jgi:hypothetical protein|nr:hypothetical protein [Cytophagaceae bacterium]
MEKLKKSPHRFLALGAALLMWCLSSCASFKTPELNSIEDFGIKTNNGGLGIQFTASISNPNAYRLVIKQAKLQVRLNNQSLGSLDMNDKLVLKGRSDFKKSYVLQSSAENLLFSLPGLLGSKKQEILVQGTIKGRVFIFSKTIPVEWRYTL